MGVTTRKVGDKEYTIRTITETVLGLVIDDSETDSIANSFGWDDKKYKDICHTFAAFYKFQDAAGDLDQELPRMTKISGFVDFLKSNSFKKLNIKIDSPNDYFMLGFVFTTVLKAMKSYEEEHDHADEDPKELLFKILKKARERRGK